MENSLGQLPQQVNEKDMGKLCVEMFQLLSKGGIKILDEHEELYSLVRRLSETNSGGSAEANAQDKSSHSIFVAGHNKKVPFLPIVAGYINKENIMGHTPLHLAAKTGNTLLVYIFLRAGANMNAEDKYKRTPLHFSAHNGVKQGVDILLKAGANVNAEDKYKQTPLHLSAGNGYKKVVEILLKTGANINAADQNKQTPLHISAKNNSVNISKLLLRAGASVNGRDIHKRSVLDYMDDEERIRHGFEPRTLFKLLNWKYSLTKSKKHVERSTSSKIKTEHTETISVTFRSLDSGGYKESHTFSGLDRGIIPMKDSSNKKALGRSAVPSSGSRPQLGRSAVPSSGPQLGRSAVPSSGPQLGRSAVPSSGPQLGRSAVPSSGPQLGRSAVPSSGPRPQLGRSAVPSSGPMPQLGRSAVPSSGPMPQLGRSAVPSSGTGSQLERPAVTSSCPDLLHSLQPQEVSHDLDDSDLQEMSSIRQQVENHWSKFSLETTEGCETSCSSEVRAAPLAGRFVMPTTIIVNRNINHTKQINISHAENVAPGGQIVVHQNRKATDDDDDSSSEDESSVNT